MQSLIGLLRCGSVMHVDGDLFVSPAAKFWERVLPRGRRRDVAACLVIGAVSCRHEPKQ